MTKKHFHGLLIILALVVSVHSDAWGKGRDIKKVAKVSVETPAGTVPRLPWQVWVTYTDGNGEWRQVRWTNSSKAEEEMEADAVKTPAGTTYVVRGYIIGDNTTGEGYPIDASVKVTGTAWTVPSQHPVAEALPLDKVRLSGNSLLCHNRDLDIKNLLSLDITQQLYNYRDTYGLPKDGYKRSDGWDSPTTKLKGHGTGHYLSALAFAYAGTDDASLKAELKSRIKRMVDEMRQCQELTFVYDSALGRYREARDLAPEKELRTMKGTWRAFDEYKKDCTRYGYGYINAIPAQHCVLIEMYRAYNNEEWVWAPYYTVHKQLAGLIDIANNIDDSELASKALLIAKDMGLWVWNRLHYRTFVKTDGTEQERRERPGNRYEMWNMYIAGEVGGMAEALSRLSEMVTDKTDSSRLLEAASYFDSPAFFNPVANNIDNVRTRHANQHIPMIIGALRSYRSNGNAYYYNLATNFWDMMMGRYVYAMGGVGNGEMWRQPYTQIASMNTNMMSGGMGRHIPNPEINETCCAYNLAKLTKDLNCYNPDDARYMDYYERVLYNQIIGSLNPEEYSVTYQYAVGLNASKSFGNHTPQESCCGGTGAENHVKYQEAAYFVNDNTLWVGLYIPTEAQWNGITVRQDCEWPAEYSKLTFSLPRAKADGAIFTLKLRVPYWATSGFDIKLNGKSLAKSYQPCSYVEIPARRWSKEDVVEVFMPFTKHINYGPDKMDMAVTEQDGSGNTPFAPQWMGTLMYGPLVMTSPDIHTWDEASMTLDANLNDVQANKGSTYTLSVNGRNFVPDYTALDRTTHYLRLDIPSGSKKAKSNGKLNTSSLQQTIQMAQERKDAQEKWEAMSVKVPEFAPWAENGYKRMLDKMTAAEDILRKVSDKKQKKHGLSQTDVDFAASSLNAAIVGMRPGNLAEPEDLKELLALIEDTRTNGARTPEKREALNYARMVVRYVNDGSGTKDMIVKAVKGLR